MIGKAIESFLREKKNMEAEFMQTAEGYLVQAKQAESWKKYVGMDSAIMVQIYPSEDKAIVNIGAGKWIDKAGAATVGMLVFAPLAITAAVGAWAQRRLPEEIFECVEKFIMSGGKTVTVFMDKKPVITEGQMLCPKCNTVNPNTAKFCVSCGEKLAKDCPNCGATLQQDAKFCPECGTKIE